MKTKKNITIYVDWDEQTIYTESMLDEAKNDRINKMYNYGVGFNDYLDETYCASEVFHKDDDELISEWYDCCVERVEKEWKNLEEVNLEVDVDITKKDCIF